MNNFWEIDSNGNFQETINFDKVDEFWKNQVLGIVSNLVPILANIDYGIYLRGSIAQNKANGLYSDIDLIIILKFKNNEIINLIHAEIYTLETLLNRKIDLDFISEEHFSKSRKWQFIIKVHSIFINGTLNLKSSNTKL
ncbi:MAG: nucleotidyltransferase domain-containing protein [Emticicia sp.]|nr:nucleotidyltransferase domain-containing protein [Emticicia sp.]